MVAVAVWSVRLWTVRLSRPQKRPIRCEWTENRPGVEANIGFDQQAPGSDTATSDDGQPSPLLAGLESPGRWGRLGHAGAVGTGRTRALWLDRSGTANRARPIGLGWAARAGGHGLGDTGWATRRGTLYVWSYASREPTGPLVSSIHIILQ